MLLVFAPPIMLGFAAALWCDRNAFPYFARRIADRKSEIRPIR